MASLGECAQQVAHLEVGESPGVWWTYPFLMLLVPKKKEVSDPSSREFVLSLWLEKQVQRSGGREAKRAAVRDLEDELLHIHNARAFRKT